MPSIFTKSQSLLRPKSGSETEGSVLRFRNLLTRSRDTDLDHLSKRILLPSLPVADEDMSRISLWESGRKLARQEAWDDLSEQIRDADKTRRATAGGQSEAMLLAMGAHADVVAAAEDSLNDHTEPNPAGILALEEMLDEYPDDYALALVVAFAHVRIARAWYEVNDDLTQTPLTHVEAATELLAPFDAIALSAPSLAAVACALCDIQPTSPDDIVATYRRLIALHPDSPQHMRAYGACLHACPETSAATLEAEAQRMSKATTRIWGAGGYAWVQFDALADAPEGLAHLDTAQFIQGLRDILKAHPDQHIANELAAFCALSMQPGQDLTDAAESARAELHACLDWLLARHLHELHPRIWAGIDLPETQLQSRTGYRALVARGRKRALRSIAAFLADQMTDGSSIAFSPAGMYRLPAI